MASSGGGALSYLANEASYDEDEVETARERIAALAARVEGRPPSPLARRMAALKGYAIGLFEIVLALIYKVRALSCAWGALVLPAFTPRPAVHKGLMWQPSPRTALHRARAC